VVIWRLLGLLALLLNYGIPHINGCITFAFSTVPYREGYNVPLLVAPLQTSTSNGAMTYRLHSWLNPAPHPRYNPLTCISRDSLDGPLETRHSSHLLGLANSEGLTCLILMGCNGVLLRDGRLVSLPWQELFWLLPV
jgi:hypothetical protein